ncbi:recombinase RecT [Lachnoclostridium sp. An169]|uniref:recombinase RecT n=1 Tax=Lachnoclostridium sp. An169 TaxID=1965569 RepID=UPI000B3AD4C9|nr:recombinase RecT [Lachnoclostridium sp. An169]OUP80756.1 recombinase RecT [Lachnoclostridium sp. An169]
MAPRATNSVKEELAKKAETTAGETKLKKSMSIADLIKAMTPEIKKALPEVITPERFTRMALSALNTTPKLQECTQMSFLAALMNAAQLGLEPNTPLGQAYLIPYNNKQVMECQFQIGYKGLIDLAYRNPQMQIVSAQTVYENDEFEYELGLNPKLEHRPALTDRGEIRLFYGLFKLVNGGFGFEVMSKEAVDAYAKEYSKSFDSSFSPWKTNYEAMAKKTVIKQALKYAPVRADFRRALSADETIKNEIGEEMSDIQGENIFDADYTEQSA